MDDERYEALSWRRRLHGVTFALSPTLLEHPFNRHFDHRVAGQKMPVKAAVRLANPPSYTAQSDRLNAGVADRALCLDEELLTCVFHLARRVSH
ncbi:MAG: hypothetical protein Q8R82_20570 [Hyphomonadaceae bacterium]|nr:hypothetical protein [Hyphomonadaceae bacterium]